MLPLFTWICTESQGQKKVVPLCPIHESAEVRFRTFGTGILVTCHGGRNHLIRLCDRAEFETELEIARAKLDPDP